MFYRFQLGQVSLGFAAFLPKPYARCRPEHTFLESIRLNESPHTFQVLGCHSCRESGNEEPRKSSTCYCGARITKLAESRKLKQAQILWDGRPASIAATSRASSASSTGCSLGLPLSYTELAEARPRAALQPTVRISSLACLMDVQGFTDNGRYMGIAGISTRPQERGISGILATGQRCSGPFIFLYCCAGTSPALSADFSTGDRRQHHSEKWEFKATAGKKVGVSLGV